MDSCVTKKYGGQISIPTKGHYFARYNIEGFYSEKFLFRKVILLTYMSMEGHYVEHFLF